MVPSRRDWFFEPLAKKLRSLKKDHDSFILYLIFTYLFSLPLIFVLLYVDPCLFNLVLPAFALLIPYKLFKEKDFKVLAVVGIIVLILLGLTFTAYQVEGIYIGRDPEELSSKHLSQGFIDRVDGDVGEEFKFTVIVSNEAYEDLIQDNNYTITVTLTRYIEEGIDVKEYNMSFQEEVEDIGRKFFIEISVVEEALYEHYFTLHIEKGNGDYEEETNRGFGPFTVGRLSLYRTIMIRQTTSTLIIFIIFLGFLWWRKGMLERAKKKSKQKTEKDKTEENKKDNGST